MGGRWLSFIRQTVGGKPEPIAASGRDRGPVSSTRGKYAAVLPGHGPRGSKAGSAADRPLGNSVGAIGWPAWGRRRAAWRFRRVPGPGGDPSRSRPNLVTYLAPPGVPARARPRGRVAREARTVVTWLILPVVICLSQRLSHACLSISNYTVKLRMAH